MHLWHTYKTPDLAAHAAADRIAEIISQILGNHSRCHIALPGGTTPAKCFYYLAQHKINWQSVHWYLGDERCLPIGHTERNDVMIRQQLWSAINAAENTIHLIPAELGAVAAAEKYAAIIDKVTLDIALLGMGEDGHTASLFPGNVALQNNNSVVPVFNSPKPPTDRVSLSVATLRQAAHRLVLTTGESKQQALRQIKNKMALPVNSIGDVEWFVDAAALASN